MSSGDTTIALRFEAIDQEKGLPESSVFAILEDHIGFIWLGTSGGLIKYDGYSFEIHPYTPEYPELAARQYGGMKVFVLSEGPYGDLWIGSGFDRPDKPSISRFDRETEKIIPYLFEPKDSTPAIHGSITSIVADSQYIWISVMQEESLIRLRPEMEYPDARAARDVPFEILGESAGILPDEGINTLLKDQKGRLWLVGKKGLYLWQKEEDTFRYFTSEYLSNPNIDRLCQMLSIAEGPEGKLWISTYRCGCVLRFDPEKKSYTYFPIQETLELISDNEGKIWVGEWNGTGGLGWLDPQTGKLTRIDIQPDELEFFPLLRVREFLEDSYGMMWIGSMEGPLLKYNPQRAAFHWLKAEPANTNSLIHDWVTDIAQDSANHYWISTFGGGLTKWNPSDNRFTHFNTGPESSVDIGFDHIINLSVDHEGQIWYGFPVISRLDPVTGSVKNYGDRSGTINTLYTDSKGWVWVGRYRSLGKYWPETGDTKVYEVINPSEPNYRKAVSGIMEDSRGDIWGGIISGKDGFFRFEPDEEQFEFFEAPAATNFCEDRKGNIWVSTVDGLFRIDPEDSSSRRYGLEAGLPHTTVNSVLEDDDGYLWVGTQNGLSRFDPEEENFRNYYTSDGLPSNSFSRACYKNEKGVLFFGGTFGIVYFHPDEIKDNQVPPKLAFTQLEILGEPIEVGEGSPLKQHISTTQKIELKHWQNDLTIHYAALHFKNPSKNRYKVMLSNYNEQWREVGTQRVANFTNLDPGSYTFRVKASNSDGTWSEEGLALTITILPPWWATWWAYLLYLVIAGAIVYAIYRFQLNRRLALLETKRLRELDHFKTKLYTNITHEFRTPLTVILGVAKEAIVQRNARRLLHLVNQMLDLSRLESGNLKLNRVQGDVLTFLKSIVESFQTLAEQKDIDLSFQTDTEELVMDYDPERLQEIVGNLLSNAVKFTPEGGEVRFAANSHPRASAATSLLLIVQDTGPGIPEEQQPYIFDRFYQADDTPTRQAEGTGIGLALTKELVQLMGGQIEVESRLHEGTTFRVRLPAITETHTPQASPGIGEVKPQGIGSEWKAEGANQVAAPLALDLERPTVLIVEDNRDVARYISSCLEGEYQLMHASDGQEGLDWALEHIPDLIISDVMMPKKDGFELCRMIKQEERSSHIPIVLLTARADMASKIEGLEYGADAYLVKPFEKEELEVRLRKLIELRHRLQARHQQPDFQPDPATQKEDAFILKVKEMLMAKLDDDTFGIDELSEALHLSRVHLHRKLKALTGKSTSHFIRQVRLQEGYRLLQDEKLNVSEVAYKVGYKDPGYFSRLFSEQYGKPPSEV